MFVAYGIGSLLLAMLYLAELEWQANQQWLKSVPSIIMLSYLRRINVEYSPELFQVMSMLRVLRLTELEAKDTTDAIAEAGPLLSMIQMSRCTIKQLHLRFQSSTAVLHILREIQSRRAFPGNYFDGGTNPGDSFEASIGYKDRLFSSVAAETRGAVR
ncbi:hypothetical protein BDQ17DRAFT_1409085 [Cyathus striatus]|nr:hypothetical protein BDQ17DRAFT_1409085 [Cyathus striatus]